MNSFGFSDDGFRVSRLVQQAQHLVPAPSTVAAESEGSGERKGFGYPLCVVGSITGRSDIFVNVSGIMTAGVCGWTGRRPGQPCGMNAYMYAGPYAYSLITTPVGARVGICGLFSQIGNRFGYTVTYFARY